MKDLSEVSRRKWANEKSKRRQGLCSHLFTNLAPYLTPTAPTTRRMKRSASRKSLSTKRHTCDATWNMLASSRSKFANKKKKAHRVVASHIFSLTSGSIRTRTTSKPPLILTSKSQFTGESKKKTIYTLSNKNTLRKLSEKERNKIVISQWAAILCHLRIGLITLLNEQNGLLSYSGNKHLLQWPATAQNVSLSNCSHGSRPYTPFLSFWY